jgi:NTP pyrophosphatase (non-canonical NTP hydrolase)
MTPEQEILAIASEECAEVIQAISKINRFGLDMKWNGTVNRDHLATELGDLLCMVDLLVEKGVVSRDKIYEASLAKKDKLKRWSNIFENI